MPFLNLNHLLNHRDSLVEEQQQYVVKESTWFCAWCDYPINQGDPVYSCSSHGCGFKLHKQCRDDFSEDTDGPLLSHLFNHRDSLVFIEEQKQYGVNESVWYCKWCELPIFPGNPLYSCSSHGCEFKLHKWCHGLPSEITEHPLHPRHPLTMCLALKKKRRCRACNRDCGGFVYWCELCEYIYLHLDCAAELIKHPSHLMKHPSHQHPLTPLPVPASFKCIGCRTKHDDGLSYQCTICPRFWLHQDCAVLPTTIERPDLHGHPLTLEYAFPKEYSNFEYPCNICGRKMSSNIWLYSCSGCRHFAHVKCAIGKWTTPPQEYGSGKVAEEVNHPDVICLPVADESSWTIGHFLEKMELRDDTNGKDDNKMINHFCHVDHPLILLNDQNKVGSTSELINHKTMTTTTTTTIYGDRRFCSGCLQIISKSTSFYGCILCDYFLHKDCAFLPTELQNHPFHPKHPLVLQPEGPKSFGLFECKACKRRCNGFTYTCENCNYYLDLKCAFLPIPITHKAHPSNHLLKREEGLSYKECHVCRLSNLTCMYQCESCNFCIDNICVQLPHTIEHRYDKHPFELTYHPLMDHPSEYFCEICEEELNPNKWFYHCTKCDQSIHLFCYFDRKVNLKYGATINIMWHPHPLAFVKPEWDSTCDFCGKSIHWPDDVGIFECVRCVKFKIHLDCAELQKLGESKEEHNDGVDR